MSKITAVLAPGKRLAALMNQSLFTNAGYLLGVNLVGALTGFVFWGLAARVYQPEEVGIASAILSVMALLSGIAGMGMGNGLIRFLPETRSPKRLLNTVFTFSALMALLVSSVYLLGLILWSPSLVALQQNGLYVGGFLAYVTTATVGAVIQMAFVARRQAGYALIHTCVIHVGRLLFVVMLARLGAVGLMGSMTLAVVLTAMFSLLILLPKVEPGYRLRPGIGWHDLVVIIPYSLGNHIAGLLTQTSQMILPLITLEILGATSSGHAYVAWMLGNLLTSPGVALAGSAFAEGSNAPHKLPVILPRAAIVGLALTLPGAAVLGITAPWILQLFGDGYAQEGTGLLRWMAAAAPLAVLVGIYYTYLRVRKKIIPLILLSGTVAAATLGLTTTLMSHFGIVVSGVGWLIGNGLTAVIAAWQIVSDRMKATSIQNSCVERQ